MLEVFASKTVQWGVYTVLLMPCAVADLTSTLGRTVMNYNAPNGVRYDSLQLSNPAKIEDFPAEAKNLEFERWV